MGNHKPTFSPNSHPFPKEDLELPLPPKQCWDVCVCVVWLVFAFNIVLGEGGVLMTTTFWGKGECL